MNAQRDICWRWFGPAYDHKCANPITIFCARIECQRAGLCQNKPQETPK